MKISELLKKIPYEIIAGPEDRDVTGVFRDNRKTEEGGLFICTSGTRFDTHDSEVISGLAEKGIKAFVTERTSSCRKDVMPR